jgi:hypothetical protein
METNPNILLLWQAIEEGALIGNPRGVELLENLTEEQITETIREMYDIAFGDRGFFDTVFGVNILDVMSELEELIDEEEDDE